MKILVTGSTGFIGAALCRALSNTTHTVRAFHRATSVTQLLDGLPVEHVVGDMTRPDSLFSAVEGIDVLFHTAAAMGRTNEPGQLYAVTVEGTRSLLEAALAAGVKRVVFTSSVASLGAPELPPHRDTQPVLIDENHTWNFNPSHWPYGYAKYMAELEVQQAVSRGLDVVIVNPTIVYGAGDIYRRVTSLVVQVARRRLPGMLDGGLNIVHIDDVVAGHLAAMEKGRTGERYILGGHNLTIPMFLQKLSAVTQAPVPPVVFPAPLARFLARYAVLLKSFVNFPVNPDSLYLAGRYFYYSHRKAQVEFGLATPRSVDDALSDAFQWFKEVGSLD